MTFVERFLESIPIRKGHALKHSNFTDRKKQKYQKNARRTSRNLIYIYMFCIYLCVMSHVDAHLYAGNGGLREPIYAEPNNGHRPGHVLIDPGLLARGRLIWIGNCM